MIEYLWATPLLTQTSPFDPQQLGALLTHARKRSAYKHAHPPANKLPGVNTQMRSHYNLFAPDQEVDAPEVWLEFRRYVDQTYRDYLREAHKVQNADDLHIVSRCVVGHYQPGMRTPPHYHHTGDHVLCLYLDCGHDRPDKAKFTAERGDGELLLLDPRPMAGFPFWEKTRYIHTEPGLLVLHPSRIWHESNPFNGSGHRTLLTVTLRVASHNYCDLYVDL